MGVSSKDFWRLLLESRLRTKAECQRLHQRYLESRAAADTADKPEREDHAVGLAKWLVSQRAVTRYQAKVLLGGQPGPFIYGNYVVRDRISEGRLRGCFRAIHAPTRCPVLLWFLDSSVANDADQYALAVAQLAAAWQAVHPCLSRTYELVDLGRFKFVVLEDLHASPAGVGACSGAEALAADGRFRAMDACRVMRHVATAAAALHSQRLVHGDIRPENVWIDQDGNGRLLQLPLSREPHSRPATPPATDHDADYTAPELAYVGQPADALTDVYAIGCTLYELLSGRPPFAGGGITEKMRRHAAEAIEPLEPLGVPRELAKVVAFAMAKDRKLRYQTAADLAEALAYFLPDEQKAVLPQPTVDAERRAAFEATQPSATSGDEVRRSIPFAPGVAGEDTPAQLAYVATMQETVSPTIVIRQQRTKSRNKGVFVLALLLALAVGGGVGYVMSSRGGKVADDETRQPDTPDGDIDLDESDGAVRKEQTGVSSPVGEQAAAGESDGAPLFVSPTSGSHISWAYLPAQAEIVLSIRPAELLRHAEGERLASASGPRGSQARAAVEEAIGMPLGEIDELTVAWTSAQGRWTVTYTVRPLESTQETLESKWRDFERARQGDIAYFVAGERAYYAPADEQGKLFVVAPVARIPEIVSAGRESAPLWREMAKLAKTSDADRLCTLMFTKNALVVEAEPRFADTGLSLLHHAIVGLFPEGYRGASISVHLDDDLYLESRLIPNPQTSDARDLATRTRQHIERLPLDIEEHISRIGLNPYGGRILIRLDTMARFVGEQLRVDVEAEQVIINGYLPAIAGHNLALGAELALVQASQAPTATAANLRPTTDSAKPLVQRLRTAVTVVQTGDTLERALQTISAEIGAPIEIMGGDLVSEGITRNNGFDLSIQGVPASDAIRAVLRKASPEGKLVYVVKPGPQGEETLFVTTRAAAEKRGDALPPGFSGP